MIRSQTGVRPKSWDPGRTLRGLKWFGASGALIGFLFGWCYAEAYLSRYVTAHYPLSPSAALVTLNDVPAWMNRAVYEELCGMVAEQADPDPLNQESLRRAAKVLLDSPWVQKVKRVERSNQGRVHVWAEYRQPMAVVGGPNGYHLVSGGGIRLPGLYLRHQLSELDMPLIEGVSQAPRLEGQVWPGSDLQAGLSLIAWLSDQPYLNQIRSIDVSARDARGRPHLVLHTRGGTVRWGLPPGMQQVVEPDAGTKKRWLANVYRQRGSIDAGGKIVDVYGAAVFVHQPVAYDDQGLRTDYNWSR